jgi:hypothetical protein
LQIPRGLKGADLVLYSVFTSLGIEADVLPVLKWEGKYGSENQMLEVESAVEDLENSYIRGDDDIDPWLRFLKNGEMPKKIKSSEFLPPGIVDAMDINQYWKLLLMSRRVDGMRDVAEYAKKEGVAVGGVYAAEGVRVGTELRPYDVTDYGYDQTLDDVSKLVWPTYYLPGIVWINEPKHEEMAFSHVVYGNDAGVETRYSAAAIFAVIPPAKDRKRILDQL